MLGLGREESRWLLCYFPVSWLTQFGHGMVTTVVGPTQPYLARSVHPSSTLSWLTQFGHRMVTTIVGPTQPFLARSVPSLRGGSHPAMPNQVSPIPLQRGGSHPAIPDHVSSIPLHRGGSHTAIPGQVYKSIFSVSWLTQFRHGMVTTVVGPTQPYLARSVHPSSPCSGSPSSGTGW